MTKKYKHKITGDIAIKSAESYFIDTVKCTTNIPANIIENSNDWEEVKEFPKIISFRSLYPAEKGIILTYEGEKCIKTSNETYRPHSRVISFSVALKDPLCEIYQVAISETEVYTLGDKVKHPFNGSNSVISKFIICKDPRKDVVAAFNTQDSIGKLFAILDNTFGIGNIKVCNLEKAPEPLFLTEDKVEIYPGDISFGVRLSDFMLIPIAHKDTTFYFPKGIKEFSTKELAEKYILENKPIYSKKQIRDIIELDGDEFTDGEVIDLLSRLVK
jgi:hypothetical protein